MSRERHLEFAPNMLSERVHEFSVASPAFTHIAEITPSMYSSQFSANTNSILGMLFVLLIEATGPDFSTEIDLV